MSSCFCKITLVGALELEIRHILTDRDLDGVVTAAILKRWWSSASISFGHPGELRSGHLDSIIDQWTVICDLPRHNNCGLSIDHHKSNAPSEDENIDCMVIWKESPSAARIAFDLVSTRLELDDFEPLIDWVDKLDSGRISREEFFSDNAFIWLGRIIDDDEKIARMILKFLEDGLNVEKILEVSEIAEKLEKKRSEQKKLAKLIDGNLRITNRLAVVRMEDLGVRSNGYHVTAIAGDECDACIVIHGDTGISFGSESGYPVSASFYTNSFIHPNGGVFDLTKMATLFDIDGGGHPNACGCRIIPLNDGQIVDRIVNKSDINANILHWQKLWDERVHKIDNKYNKPKKE